MSTETPPAADAANEAKPKRSEPAIAFFAEIIRAVQTPLGFCTLMVLVLGAFLAPILTAAMAAGNVESAVQITLALGLFTLFVLLIGAVIVVEFRRQHVAQQRRERKTKKAPEAAPPDSERAVELHQDILHSQEGPPEPDAWDRELRPVLHQAAFYSVPTYFLDTKLRVIDWNVAFELVFGSAIGKIRGRHVNYFIVKLENQGAVFDHARLFTNKVNEGHLPLVDTEPLRFISEAYGLASFLKVAVQLHDADAQHRGWAVALFPVTMAWDQFQRDLEHKIAEDKLWSVYSASYDRVLKGFPPYQKLIDDVIRVIPGAGQKVADLGAGTGNVTRALLERHHTVTAVESNQAMLDRLRAKRFNPAQVSIVKASIERLEMLPSSAYDAAVAVNVLYAIDNPFSALQNVHRILKPGGLLAFSTTHSETSLDKLLASIRNHLTTEGRYSLLESDFHAVEQANRHIALTIARRWRREQYREWTVRAGFVIVHEAPSTYEDAVMLVHARKV